MNRKGLRSSLATILIIISVLSVLPQAYAGPAQNQGKSRREPPPFDRPPIGSGGQQRKPAPPPQTQNQYPDAGEVKVYPPQKSQRQADPAESNNPDAQDQPRDGDRQRPVLRRPADSRTQSDQRREDQAGGQRQPAPDGGDDTVKLDATLVNIPVLVSDRSGRYVPQLSEKDFLIYEDGVAQEVAFFGDEEVPFHVALVLDMSPSVQGNSRDIQEAAIEFVRHLRSEDRVMVVSFDRSVHYLTDFTNNRRDLESAIRMTQTGSGTSVYDAVFETVMNKMRGIDGRKALLLFSDGEDTTSSRASYDDAIEAVSESDVLVYGLRYPGTNNVIINSPRTRSPIPQIPLPIPFPWPWPRRRRGGWFAEPNSPSYAAPTQNWPRRGRNGDFMADITAAGGGPVYDAERIGDLGRLANRIAEELRHVYVVSYYPTNSLSNGGFRSVRIRLKGRDDIAVRHRRGYNAREAGTRRT